MKKHRRNNINWYTIIVVIFAILVISAIVFEIVVFCKYYNKPVGEIPAWAAWLLFGR